MQFFPHDLNNSVSMFGVLFALSECEMLLQDWIGSKPNLVLACQNLHKWIGFSVLGSYISPDGLMLDEVSLTIENARLVFTDLKHLVASHLDIRPKVEFTLK